MRLSPRDQERLTIFTIAELARKRRARGHRLGHPEAVGLICDEMHEGARDGLSYEAVIELGQSVLTREDVMDGVAEMIPLLHLEVMFADGTKLVAVRNPIR
ncbi:urease subunit gamma [Pseudonocardia sp.]|uniref:urease subunit gamma n=1 Tax=Pseudonocardia sp. TaxID=60912 RepID=UPI00262F1860|nr:urease subunit gamma [Pseudonocardia sp.]